MFADVICAIIFAVVKFDSFNMYKVVEASSESAHHTLTFMSSPNVTGELASM